MTERTLQAFAARKYAVTRVQMHARGMATVYLDSIEGVTAGTLYSRFADCTWIQVAGFGYDPNTKLYAVMVRIRDD